MSRIIHSTFKIQTHEISKSPTQRKHVKPMSTRKYVVMAFDMVKNGNSKKSNK